MLPNATEIEGILADCGLEDCVLAFGPIDRMDSPGIIACALAYPLEGDPEPEPGVRPFGTIASFARAHYYRVLVKRLIRARGMIAASFAALNGGKCPVKGDFPIRVNSRINEKLVACAAGLGKIGLHSLLITEKSGCACVIGIMGLPFAPEGSAAPFFESVPHPDCTGCRACQRSCPTRAIRPEGGVDLDRCLQAYMSDNRPVPEFIEKAWEKRLYGCDVCLRACPHSNGATPPGHLRVDEEIGMLGSRMDLEYLIRSDDATISRRLKDTALGLSWLGPETLKKNARIASKAWTAEEEPT